MESQWITKFRPVQQSFDAIFANPALADPPALPREECEDRRTIDIYRAVLRNLFGVQSLSGRNLPKPFLFIQYSEPDAAQRRTGDQPALNETVRQGITRGSDNLPVRIAWIEDSGDAGRGREEKYTPSGGAVVRFTGIRRAQNDVTLVKGILHNWGMEPCAFELAVERRGGFSMVKNSGELPAAG